MASDASKPQHILVFFSKAAYLFSSKTLECNSALKWSCMVQCSTQNPKERRHEASMEFSVKPNATLNGGIRREWDDGASQAWTCLSRLAHWRADERWELSRADADSELFGRFWGGGRSRAFALSAVMGILERFLEVGRRVLICQLFGHYTSTDWRVILWNGDVQASAPRSVVAGLWKCALSEHEKSTYKSLQQ